MTLLRARCRFFLVVLHADDDLAHAEHLGEVAAAADDLSGALKHRAMVAGDVGLALRAVDDDGIDLADAAGDLRVRGERCAAHTDDTGLLDHFDHFLHAQRVGVGRSMDFLAQVVLEVIVDDNGHDLAAHGIGTGLHRSDRTGYACVNGSAETFEFADLLSKLDIVALGDRRGCRVRRSASTWGSPPEQGLVTARWPFSLVAAFISLG